MRMCWIDNLENQKVIFRFQNEYPNFSIEPVGSFLPKENEIMQTEEGYWQTFPHLHNMDGSFAVRLRKT